jgi:MtN3 and saliva related transmembrane protein
MLAGIIGTVSAILTTSAFLPQVVKSLKTGRTGDLSYPMLLLQCSGNMLWIAYGVMIHSASIAVANLVTGVLVGSILVVKIRHRAQAGGAISR